MKILVVIDDYSNKSNGLCISTQRFVKEFRKHGHEVRIVSCTVKAPNYPVPELIIPFFNKIIHKEGYHMAVPKRSTLKKAIDWCDVVAIETPFPISWIAARIAKKKSVPVYGTFHIYPGNITESLHINYAFFNKFFMYFFRNISFKNCLAIQCPTKKVKQQLQKYHFRKQLYVISNGIPSKFMTNPHKEIVGKPFTIICIGRYSKEKKQITLFNALVKSKHASEFKIIFAGKGPLLKEYQKIAKTSPYDITLQFYSPDQLLKVLSSADVVVHCADVEVEGMAPMEAFASGCVPIIANSSLSSTASYALTPNNLFPVENSTILAKRLDYWYEHPQELKDIRKQYRQYSQTLSIDKSAEKALKMIEKIKK